MKILIIEDDPDIIDILSSLLESQGYQVEVAVSAISGLAKLLKAKYRLVLLDLGLPNEDTGLEILREARSLDSRIPIVVVTGFIDRHPFRTAMELGASDYITKPFTEAEILGAISAQLGRLPNKLVTDVLSSGGNCWQLELHGYQCEPQIIPIDGSTVVLGRNKDCEISINDPQLSRQHCTFQRIEEDAKKYYNLVSGTINAMPTPCRNGVWVNQVLVDYAVRLRNKDLIWLSRDLKGKPRSWAIFEEESDDVEIIDEESTYSDFV